MTPDEIAAAKAYAEALSNPSEPVLVGSVAALAGDVLRVIAALEEALDWEHASAELAKRAVEQAKAWAGKVKAACARIADDCDLSRPAMADGPLKDEWEAGVADASVSIEEAILAFDVDKVKP